MKKQFLDMSISKKLLLGFLLVTFLAVVIGVVGIFNNFRMSNADTALYEEDTLGLQYAGAAAVEFQQIRYNSLKAVWLNGSDIASIKTVAKDIEVSNQRIGELFVQCKETIKSEEILTYIDELAGYWQAYTPMMDQLISYKLKGNQAEVDNLVSPMAQQGVTLRDGFLELFNKVSAEASAKSASNTAMGNQSTITMIAVIIISIIIAVFLSLFIANIIGKPVAFSAKVANMLAAGNLDTNQMQTGNNEALYVRQDEVGELARAFRNLTNVTAKQASVINQVEQGDLTVDVEVRSENDLLGKSLSGLVNNLNDLTSGIISAADQVASGAALVSNSSMTLSQGATEQASAIEELTASLEEISSQTVLNAQNAEKASLMATNAKTEAEQGNAQMKVLLNAMDAINASSTNINKIIKVIDDIAFQTNILALNAAVEAARAGQYGKGFAVVAEEVRTLAGKSANAVKDTTEMIDGSIRNVESGIKIANETAEALKRIVTEVSNATELVGSIAIASKEQALGIEQLNQGIVQVSQVVQSNASTSEESAAASEELSSQADQLKEVVSVFKVKNVNHPSKLSAASVGTHTQARALPSNKPRTKIELESGFGKY